MNEWMQAGLWVMQFAAISLWCVLCIAAGVYYGIRWASRQRVRPTEGPLTNLANMQEAGKRGDLLK